MDRRESESMICDEATHWVLMVGEVAHLMATRDPVKRKEGSQGNQKATAFEDSPPTPYVLTSPCLIIVTLLCLRNSGPSIYRTGLGWIHHVRTSARLTNCFLVLKCHSRYWMSIGEECVCKSNEIVKVTIRRKESGLF